MGVADASCSEEEEAELEKMRQGKLVEARQGFSLWRSIDKVVGLTVNVRAPGVLSRLQHERHASRISDQLWELYLSRVMAQTTQGVQIPILRLRRQTCTSLCTGTGFVLLGRWRMQNRRAALWANLCTFFRQRMRRFTPLIELS